MGPREPTASTAQLVAPVGPIPLGYVEAPGEVLLIARERSASWPIALFREGQGAVSLPHGILNGTPELVTDPDARERVLQAFREKYGDTRFHEWYDHPYRVIRLKTGGAAPSRDAVERYSGWLRAEFDNVADDYDRHITGNRMNRLLRDRSLGLLRATFGRSRRILDVGCGSGMETLPLLRDGHEVVAVDISDRMLDVVRTKARAEGLSERLSTHRARASELPSIEELAHPGSVDGAYSTYGALNCEPELAPVARGLAGALAPGTPFVAGVFNRWCLFELAGFGITGQFDRAFGRLKRPVPVGASRFCIDVFAYSAPEFSGRFAPEFRPVHLEGVPVLLPPSDLTMYAERFSRKFNELAGIDRWVARRWPWVALGDHFLMVLRRSDPTSAAS